MVIDTSALIAILLNEPETEAFAAAISAAPSRMISAVSALETAIVIEAKKGAMGGQLFGELLVAEQVNIVAFDQTQFNLAREAYARFGKGRHPAALNFGGCCAYALARNTGEALLLKGQDFSATDISVVV